MVSSNGAVAICPRTETGSKKYIDGSGYLHVIDKTVPMPPFRADEAGKELPEHNLVLSRFSSKMMEACTDERIGILSRSIGVPSFALRLLRVGWSASSDAYSFPMFRDGQRLIGIRLRSLSSKKWAVKGSKQGLFMPFDWPRPGKGIVICEGPTDTAAVLGMGMNAIGRPSAMGSHALVGEVVEGMDVCLISDSDEVGIDSATKLARFLKTKCRRVGILVPPAKDARAWISSGSVGQPLLRSLIAEAIRSTGPLFFRSTSRGREICCDATTGSESR
jgi:hypothetical protein